MPHQLWRHSQYIDAWLWALAKSLWSVFAYLGSYSLKSFVTRGACCRKYANRAKNIKTKAVRNAWSSTLSHGALKSIQPSRIIVYVVPFWHQRYGWGGRTDCSCSPFRSHKWITTCQSTRRSLRTSGVRFKSWRHGHCFLATMPPCNVYPFFIPFSHLHFRKRYSAIFTAPANIGCMFGFFLYWMAFSIAERNAGTFVRICDSSVSHRLTECSLNALMPLLNGSAPHTSIYFIL